MTSQQQQGSLRNSADTASFPNPIDITERPSTGPHAPSIISSRMTDIADEDGEGGAEPAATAGASQGRQPQSLLGRVQGLTGPVGEAGLPPSRPSSAATGKSGAYSQAASRKPHGSVAGSTGAASTRPPTAQSRTHVPSLTSSAFFRPMSSQRLQAQRGQRPMSLLGPTSAPANDSQNDYGPADNRQSNGSGQHIRAGPGFLGLHHEERPTTRGTDVTDMPDRTTANTSPNGAETVRSRGESEAPLSGDGPPQEKPTHLDLSKQFKNSASNLPPQKSPRSFRSSFILPNRNSRNSTAIRSQGHEKLESNPSTPRYSQRETTKQAVKTELGKNYEYFTGNTVFWWGGRLQNTREKPINIATGLAMVLPAALFFGFSAPWLWHNISPAIPILFAYVFAICLSSFLHASAMNPGILPRNLHPFPPPNPNEDPLTLGPALTEWTMVVSATSSSAAMEVPTKYCKTCNIWRPPRAHHCRTCDNCIETQDHHCVWLNNCVGRRNYRHFFTFVISGAVLSLFLLAASLAHILVYMDREGVSFAQSIDRWRVPFAMVLYGFLISLYPISLSGYHLFLMARGETTREYLQSHKFLKKDRHRPFTQGNFWKNWVVVLFRPRPPTYLNFKKEYEEGDQRFGERRGKRTTALAPEQQGGGLEMQNIGDGIVPGFQGPTSRGGRTAGTQ